MARIYSSKTGFRGVWKHRRRFVVYIRYKGKRYYLGSKPTAEEAAVIYDRRARQLFGDRAVLNFPEL